MIYENILDFAGSISQEKALMGLDLGSKTIGVAISDSLKTIATPLKTIKRTKFSEEVTTLFKLISERDLSGIILGLPKNMDGSEGPSSQSAKDFAKNLSNDVTKNITLWDERLSSQGAFNLSSELAINSSKKVKKLDENSAQFILQGVLDFYHKKNT